MGKGIKDKKISLFLNLSKQKKKKVILFIIRTETKKTIP